MFAEPYTFPKNVYIDTHAVGVEQFFQPSSIHDGSNLAKTVFLSLQL